MVEQSNVPPPPETSGARGGKGAKAKDKASGILKFLNAGLLAFVAFGWVAWFILLAGVSAVTNTARDFDGIDSSTLTSLTWVVTWFFFILLIALTASAAGSLVSSKLRSATALINRGMTFFLAVLVAWLGVDCNDYAQYHRTLGGEFSDRVDCVLAGEILCLIACFLIVLSLLSIDHLHAHSDKFNQKVNEREANKESRDKESRDTGTHGTHGGSHVTGGGPVQARGELQQPVRVGTAASGESAAPTQPAANSAVPPYNPGPHASQV